MESEVSASTIFTPGANDYAIGILERIFGGTVTTLTGGEAGSTHAMLVSIISAFNVAVLFFATVVVIFLIYQLFLDTARDGEFGGRENNMSVTALRAGIGAALLLPVKGGFSIIQIVVIQLLIFGSGMGDYVWSVAATEAQSGVGYAANTKDQATSFMTARKFSAVLQARTSGYLCMLHANNISATLGTGDAPLSAQGPVIAKRRQKAVSESWYFGAGEAYENRNDMCGSTSLVFASPEPRVADESIYGGNLSYGQKLTQLTNQTVRVNAEAAVASLDVAAKSIAQDIFDGNRDTENIKKKILTAVDTTTTNFVNGMASSMTSSAATTQLDQLKKSMLDAATENGWMFAASWQRSLATYVTKLNNAQNDMNFVNSDTVEPKSAGTTFMSWLTGYSDTQERLFAAVDEDYEYLSTFEGAFVQAGEPDPVDKTSLEKLSDSASSHTALLSAQWFYNTMFNVAETGEGSDSWNDPLISIQELGQRALVVSGITIAGSTALDVGGKVGALGMLVGSGGTAIAASAATYAASDYISDMISYMGWGLLALSIVLAVILPFLPFVYFLSGAVGWVIMAIEAVIAAPIWILLTFAPHRSGDLIGTNKQGLLLLIGVFFRPALLILGLIACFLVLRVSLDFTNLMFGSIYAIVAPDFDLMNFLMAFGLIAIYVLVLIVLVSNCCAMITGVSDAVMEFIGVRVSQLGQNNIAGEAVQALSPTNRYVGAVERSVSSAGARTNEARKSVGNQLGAKRQSLLKSIGNRNDRSGG